jgi:hypothetical protein
MLQNMFTEFDSSIQATTDMKDDVTVAVATQI